MKKIIIVLIIFVLMGCAHQNPNKLKLISSGAHFNFGDNYYRKGDNIYFRDRNPLRFMTGNSHYPERVRTDAETFEVLSHFYAKDKKGLLFCGKRFHADPNSFYIFPDSHKKPKFDKLFPDPHRYSKIIGAPMYIKVWFDAYARDKKRVFIGRKRIKGCNVDSFEILNFFYSKDDKSVFTLGKKLYSCDVESFEVVAGQLAKDRKYIFYSGEKIARNKNNLKILNEFYFTADNKLFYLSGFSCLSPQIECIDNSIKIDSFKEISVDSVLINNKVYEYGCIVEDNKNKNK